MICLSFGARKGRYGVGMILETASYSEYFVTANYTQVEMKCKQEQINLGRSLKENKKPLARRIFFSDDIKYFGKKTLIAIGTYRVLIVISGSQPLQVTQIET